MAPLDSTAAISVCVCVGAPYAHLPAVQHTTWMLVNLLARLERVVSDVVLDLPRGIPLHGRVIPFAKAGDDLLTALERGIDAIGVIPRCLGREADFAFAVGPGGSVANGLRVVGDGWTGGVSCRAVGHLPRSVLPIGPYIAACIGVGEVFCRVRVKKGIRADVEEAFFSAWSLSLCEGFKSNGPVTIPSVSLDAGLAGIGAVANAWLHTMWSTPTVSGRVCAADNDRSGIEQSNLNRYSLFGSDSVGRHKACEARRMLASAAFLLEAREGAYESIAFDSKPLMLISAVDRNTARQALQWSQLAPRILSASTRDLRAEILRCGPPGTGACLRCYNEPETVFSDNELRARLREGGGARIATIAQELGMAEDDVRNWAQLARCGETGERITRHLRKEAESDAPFAVGFVSVLAGTLLAAETCKESMQIRMPLNDSTQRAVFQFLRPLAESNRPSFLATDPECPFCRSPANSDERRIWRQRYQRHEKYSPRT